MDYSPIDRHPLTDTRCRVLEAMQIAAVIQEARSWIGTPWHHRANVKGAGVDCARLLIEVYANAGVIEWFDPGDYPPDWHCHRSEELFANIVLRFAMEYDPQEVAQLPGDVVLWRYGRCFSHGGIVTRWPSVVHAFAPYRMVDETPVPGSPLDGREMRAFRPLAWIA